MDVNEIAAAGERKVLRRGLIAGLAGLGAAALMRLTNTDRAAASDFSPMIVGTTNYADTAATSLQLKAPSKPTMVCLNTSGIYTFPFGDGIQGFTDSQTGFSAGVRGVNQLAGVGCVGVVGESASANGVGVVGRAGATFGAMPRGSIGVEGQAGVGQGIGTRGMNSANGTGVQGISNASDLTADGNGGGIGVHGKSGSGPGVRGDSTSAAGVLGVSVSQPGVDGTSTNSLGIRGTSTNFVGIVGISTNSHGLYGSSNSGVNGFGIVAENNGPNGRGLLVTGTAQSQIFGGLQVFGAKNAVLKMQDGTFGSVYCQESPEPYFEDFGRAQLVGGVANVPLEREFASLVAGGDYMVFPVADGLCGNLCITRRSPSGFEVREANGQSNVPFTYRIVTRRKDIEGKRFARVSTEAAEQVAGVRAMLAAMPVPGSMPAQPVVPPTTPVVTVGPGLNVVPPGR